jgi:hypothetical protein
MVLRWTKSGKYCWHEPPYTQEEIDDFYRRTDRGPVAFTRPDPPSVTPPLPPQSAATPPAKPRRARGQQTGR